MLESGCCQGVGITVANSFVPNFGWNISGACNRVFGAHRTNLHWLGETQSIAFPAPRMPPLETVTKHSSLVACSGRCE